MNKYLAFILLLFLTMPMCLNGQDYPGTATGIDIDRTAIGTNVGKALPNKVMTLNADKEFTGASKIGSDEIETEHISVLLGDEIEDIEYPAPIHFGYKQAIEAIKAYKNTLSNAQDIVNVTDRVTVLETNTYTKAETDNLLDEKTDTNTVSLIDDRVTVLETGVYTKVETDTLMLEKATTNDIKELENRVTIVETNFDSHINDNMVDIKHVTDTEKGLIDTALQPGATGTSTNLSEYNNDAGYITNAGVESLNSLTGGVTFEDGTNTTVRIDGQKIYIDSEGGGSGGITNFGITDKDAYRGDWADAISNVVSDTIVPVRDVSAIAAGAYHFLALKKGKVIVWGENNWGQTNIPESLNSNVSAIACGNYHSLAIKGGEVISWGNNNNGQTNVPLEAQSGVTAIAGGYFHSLALKDGGVIAWGQNNKGQTTIPDTATNGVTAISAGYYFSLALKDGGVIAWGDNQHGQTDVPIEAQSGVTDISGGSHYSLALKNGKVISWGENATNVPLEAQSGVTAIAASFSHSTAIKNGEIIKWDMDGNIVPNSITNNIISNDFKEFNIIALNESGTVEIDGPYSDSVPLELTMPSYSYTLDLHGGSAHIGGDIIDGYGITDTTAYRGDLGHALSNRLDAIDASGFVTLDEVKSASPLMTNKTAVQIGSEASAASGGGVAVGRNTVAGPSAVAIGDGAQATGTSVAIGWGVNNEETNTTMLNGTLNMADYGIKNLASLSLTNGSVIQGYGTSSTTAYRGDCGNAVSNLAQGALPKPANSPVEGAMLLADAGGQAVWGNKRSYVYIHRTQSTNLVPIFIESGFKPSSIICYATTTGEGSKETPINSLGFCDAQTNMVVSPTRTSDINSGQTGLLWILWWNATHSGWWGCSDVVFHTNGVALTPKINANPATNDATLFFLLQE